MNAPVLSFIITVYNKAKFLPKVLPAIKDQNLDAPCEYIIVNDGSTDDSAQIVENIAGSWDGVNIINQRNKGVVEATLIGLQAAHGEFIKFVDGDDLLLPTLTRHQLSLMENHPELDYAACSCGWMNQGRCQPKYGDYEKISNEMLEKTDVEIFRDQNALWSVLSRNGGFAEALTGMSGGLSRKSRIDIEKAAYITKKFHLRQMQDHLISASSLLHGNCGFAFIKKIGFIELSKSTVVDRSNTLSTVSPRGWLEQALINHAFMEYLADEQKLSLMHSDLKVIFRALHGKASFGDKLWPYSPYNRTRSIRKKGRKTQIETHYQRLMEELLKSEKEGTH